MAKMFNRARMTVTSTGTGALSLGVAVAGYQTFSSAGAQNNDVVSYAVEDGLKWEIGTGTYNSVAGTLSRTVTQSFDGTTYGTTAISVTTSAQVFISPLAADLQYGTSAGNLVQLDGSARLPAVDGSLVTGLNASNIGTGTLGVARGGTGTGTAFTTGSVVFAGTSGVYSQDNSNFFWDNTNKRLGIGTASPSSALHVVGGEFRLDSASGAVGRWYYNGTNVGTIYVTSDLMLMGAEGSRSFVFNTNGSEKLRLTADGNLGLGVTPSAWYSSGRAIDLNNTGSITTFTNGGIGIYCNAYLNTSAAYIYKINGYAGYYQLQPDTGKHVWNIAGSGSAGAAITFTQAMTLTADGNLAVGTTSSVTARLKSAAPSVVVDTGDASGHTSFLFSTDAWAADKGATLSLGGYGGLGWSAGQQGALVVFGSICGRKETSVANHSGYLQFNTMTAGGTLSEKARITSGGNLVIGTTATGNRLTVASGTTVSSPTLGTLSGTTFFGGSDMGYGLITGQSSSGQYWAQVQRIDGSATAYDLLLQPSGGNLLVGTTSQATSSKVTVSGSVAAVTNGVDGTYAEILTAPYASGPTQSSAILASMSSVAGNCGFRFDVSSGTDSSRTTSLTVNRTSVTVAGSLSKGSGSFKIDHPLPELTDTHHLVHSFIEGPQADLIYRGVAQLINGVATINIDEAAGMTEGTFVLLCREVQCFTCNETDWDAVRGKVTGNILTIESKNSASTASVSWLVIGERRDKHMFETDWTDANGKVIVEPAKVQALEAKVA